LEIDVEGVETRPPVPYDVAKGKLIMKECERHLQFVRDNEVPDEEWEDKVNKSGDDKRSLSLAFACSPSSR
jgi:hypothetical protein